MWIRNVFAQVGLPLNHPIPIGCDSQLTLAIAKDQATHERSKHFDVKVHKDKVRECLDRNIIPADYIPTAPNPADILTKPIVGERFKEWATGYGLHPEPATPNLYTETSFNMDATDATG